jgi:hypothetical protein
MSLHRLVAAAPPVSSGSAERMRQEHYLDGHGGKLLNRYLPWADSLTLAGRTLYFDSAGALGGAPGIGRVAVAGSGLQTTGASDFGISPFMSGNFVGDPGAYDGQLVADGAHLYWLSPLAAGSQHSQPGGMSLLPSSPDVLRPHAQTVPSFTQENLRLQEARHHV